MEGRGDAVGRWLYMQRLLQGSLEDIINRCCTLLQNEENLVSTPHFSPKTIRFAKLFSCPGVALIFNREEKHNLEMRAQAQNTPSLS